MAVQLCNYNSGFIPNRTIHVLCSDQQIPQVGLPLRAVSFYLPELNEPCACSLTRQPSRLQLRLRGLWGPPQLGSFPSQSHGEPGTHLDFEWPRLLQFNIIHCSLKQNHFFQSTQYRLSFGSSACVSRASAALRLEIERCSGPPPPLEGAPRPCCAPRSWRWPGRKSPQGGDSSPLPRTGVNWGCQIRSARTWRKNKPVHTLS